MNYELEITKKCNFGCLGCNRLCDLVNDMSSDMSMPDVTSVVDQINNLDKDQGNITVIGGEPTLNKACEDICMYLKDNLPNMRSFTLATNHSNNSVAARVASLGFTVRTDDGSEDPARISESKLGKHCNILISPKERGMDVNDPAGCWIMRDCGISIHKWDGSVVWTWCGPGTSISKLLCRENEMKPSLYELLNSDKLGFFSRICANCMHLAKDPVMVKDSPEQVSECFKRGLDKINEYAAKVGVPKSSMYNIWVSYHDDNQIKEYDLKNDGHHRLFPTHKDAFLENINHMSRIWCELVTIWYVYHNRLKSDIVGFSHYRRQIKPSRIPKPGECAIFTEFGVSTPYDQYKYNHHSADMDIVLDILDKRYGTGNPYSIDIRNAGKVICCNCFVMTWDDFIGLCDYLFPVLQDFSEATGCGMDPELWRARTESMFPGADENRIRYQMRVVGFLAERLVSAYIHTNMFFYY